MKRKFELNMDDGDGDELPDEIVEDILSRLHPKTLMKLRVVCKKWKSFISNSSHLNRLHNKKSLKNPNLLILSCKRKYVLTTVSLTGDVVDEWDLPLIPLASHPNSVFMLPSQCGPNNLVCFLINYTRFIVCNPSVRKIIHIPQFSLLNSVTNAYGFCYLPPRNQYVIIVSGDNRWQMITFSLSNLHTCSWKPIENRTPYKVRGNSWGIFANGFFNWTGAAHDDHHQICLLCFDLYDKKFFAVSYPDELKVRTWGLHHELNGDLYVMASWGDYNSTTTPKTFWKLEDVRNQIWIKQYAIYMPESYVRPFMVDEDGDVLVYDLDGEFVGWYSLQQQQKGDDQVLMRNNNRNKVRSGVREFIWNMKLHHDTLL